MTLLIRRAVPADLPTVLAIIHGAADWLHERGYEQWPHSSPTLGPEALGAQIGREEMNLASDGTGNPVAVIAVSHSGDLDFWSPAELAVPAAYLSKAAVVRRRAGDGVGGVLLRWAVDQAWADGCTWVRLDAWRDNMELQAYYRRQGWQHMRTVDAPGRKSGALFQVPARPDPWVRGRVTEQDAPQITDGDVARWREDMWLRVGAPVILARPDGPVAATVTGMSWPDYAHHEVAAGWEYGAGRPPVLYKVTTADGYEHVVHQGDVWLDPQRVAASPAEDARSESAG